jgi:predicted TIM-barrel fold metal-dependent hydrolase
MTPIIDTHMHVFRADLPMAASRRNTPTYDATWEDYRALSEPFGITAAVIVQPSFLGTDNSFMLEHLERLGNAARGVAVIDADTPIDAIDELHDAGVRGIRFNQLSHTNATLPDIDAWQRLFDRMRPLGWHVELHASPDLLRPLLELLEPQDLPIIVDHFGRPGPEHAADHPDYRHLVARGSNPNLFCKVSAPYRLGGRNEQPYFDALVETFTLDRLLWASDWPWTQNEGRHTYADCIAWRERMLANHPGAFERMNAAAIKLFDFA